jgi:hypothetical protein
VKSLECADTKICKDIAINYQERTRELIAKHAERTNSSKGLVLLGIMDAQAPLPAIAAVAFDQMSQGSGCDIYVPHVIAIQPPEQDFQHWPSLNRHQWLGKRHRIRLQVCALAAALNYGLHGSPPSVPGHR